MSLNAGQYCIPGDTNGERKQYGAVPPFLIHKQPSIKRGEASKRTLHDVYKETVSPAYTSGLMDVNDDIGVNN